MRPCPSCEECGLDKNVSLYLPFNLVNHTSSQKARLYDSEGFRMPDSSQQSTHENDVADVVECRILPPNAHL